MTGGETRFPCSECGADLRFQPGTDSLECAFCGTTNALPERGAGTDHLSELDFEKAVRDKSPAAQTHETRLGKCDNCGAEIEFGDAEHATECAFCAAPIVVGTGLERRIKPAALIPFILSEKDARKAMTKWLGKLWFAPGGLQEYARKGRKMQGIYTPFWTYDADTKSRYKGQRGTVYYETRTVRVQVDGKMQTQQEQVQKIRWSPASGRVKRFFNDVLVLASTSLPKSYTDALKPWNLEALKPFSRDYLAGFHAEGYTVSLEDGYAEARHHMDNVIDGDVRTDIGGDRQQVSNIDTTVSDVTFKHILLPVWMAAYKYRGKSYRFVVNGQSGNVKGERPYSKMKIALAIVAAIVLIAIIGLVVAAKG